MNSLHSTLMETDKRDCMICPVCSLYLREGITLKSHLQTHSKEKVIEALLRQDSSLLSPGEDSGLATTPTEDDTAAISNYENRFFNSSHRPHLPFSALSSSFLQSTTNQVTQPTQALSYDGNNVQYSPVVNNLVTQPAVNNSCNTVLTYQTYVTNEGNIILIPVYNMCPPQSVMLSSNVVPSTAVVNPCVVMPPSNAVVSVNVNDTTSTVAKYTSASSVQDISASAIRTVEPNENGEAVDCQSSEPGGTDDNEKATDEEVASIFKISRPNNEYDNKKYYTRMRSVSYDSEMTAGSKSDSKSNSASYLESELCSTSCSLSEHTVEIERTSVTPNVSVIRIGNDVNYASPTIDIDEMDAKFCSLPSTSSSTIVTTAVPSNAVKKLRKCEADDLSDSCGHSPSSFEQESEEYEEDETSKDGTATSMLDKETEDYILPNRGVPHSPVSMAGDFNFLGISKSLMASSSSLISSVNKTVFTDVDVFSHEKNSTSNFFDKCEMKSEEKQISEHTLTNYIRKLTDKEEEEYMNVDENFGSACSSRVSPFDIQTDESMPARGELSGQESLSGTENSIWELQVQQNTCVQRYSISCRGENPEIKIGLHSLMTEMNIKRDIIENLQPADFDSDRAVNELVDQNFTNTRLREFHCFYCQKTFNKWKLRQKHIVDEHAEEDGLTIEFLFGRREKVKVEETKEESVSPGDEENANLPAAPAPDNIVCRMCSTTVGSTVALLKHLKLTHNIKKRSLVCPTCFEHFNTNGEYRHHIKKVHPYECMTCGKQFYTRPGYMLHQKRHMKIKPYSCSVCSKSFVTKQKLSEHMNIHTGDNPIKCDMCDSNFKRYSNYQQHKKYLHMNCKRKLKDFVCDCGDVFHSKVKLLWHQEIHDQKPKQCPFCVERFVHAASLTRHVRKWHNEMYLSEWMQKKKNVSCPICNVSYLHTSLQTHMKIHEGVKPFSCTECSKTFRTKWNLQLHRWTHMSRSSKPFKCKLCVKAYIHKTDYDAHIRSHSNCRPYACNVCGRQFIRKYNCIRHMREHIEPRSYKCLVCGKEFARSYYLSEHEKVHTGEKPHICHFCGKASATKSNHNKHVKMHTVARETINSEA